jgi:hypothetical protein
VTTMAARPRTTATSSMPTTRRARRDIAVAPPG